MKIRSTLARIRSFQVYVAAVSACGGVVLVTAAREADWASVLVSSPFWVFLVMLVIAELKPIEWLGRHGGAEVTASWSFSFALLLLDVDSAIVATAVAGVFADLVHRKGTLRTTFNAAQMALSLALGGAVLGYYAAGSAEAPTALWLGVVTLAGSGAFLLNGILTCVVLALYRKRSVLSTIAEGLLQNFSTDGMLLALAPVFVILATQAFAAVPLLLLTAWAVYRSTVLAVRREHEATHDQLTGLANRRYFTSQAGEALRAALRRPGGPLAIALIDLNGFKEINDLLGHHIGDKVLQLVAARLDAGRRAGDLVARIGGDEFAVLFRQAGTAEQAAAAAERLDADLRAACIIEGFPLAVSGSFGVALAPSHGSDVDTLLQNADVAMYQAKQAGGGVRIYSDDAARFGQSRMELLAEVQRAIESEEFVLHWQPKVDVHSAMVVGAEALVRWKHPKLGLTPPDDFIPLAEHTELMGPFTDMVLDLALRQAATWMGEGLHLEVAVNGSARNLHDLQFPTRVRRLLDKWNVPASQLDLEITENTMMADPARTRSVLEQLRAIGVSLSIDDFGTGYSSLANLRDLPVGRVKIDRSFVKDMVENHSDQSIVRAIIDLARNLGMGTVAEGVEDVATLDLLRTMGCETAQGYHFSRPLPASEFSAWVRRWRSSSLALEGVAS